MFNNDLTRRTETYTFPSRWLIEVDMCANYTPGYHYKIADSLDLAKEESDRISKIPEVYLVSIYPLDERIMDVGTPRLYIQRNNGELKYTPDCGDESPTARTLRDLIWGLDYRF